MLLLLSVGVNATLQAAECNARYCTLLPTGVLFVKEREMTLSGFSWTITSSLEIKVFDKLITGISELLHEFQAETLKLGVCIPETEWNRVNQGLYQVRGIYDQIDLLVGDEAYRQKRGLFNSVGTGLKLLFGTIDEQDFNLLNEKIVRVAAITTESTHLDREQISYIKTLQDGIKITQNDVDVLAGVVKNKLTELSIKSANLTHEINVLNSTMTAQNSVNSVVRTIEYTIMEIHLELTQIQMGLDVIAQGRISAALASPYKLAEMLTEVQRRLPEGLTLLSPPTIGDVHIYYSIITAYAIRYEQDIRLILDVPLRRVDRHFEVYKIFTMPVFNTDLKKMVSLIEVGQYLAISKNRQNYAVITNEELAKCSGGQLAYCEPTFAVHLRVEASCAAMLFMQQGTTVPAICGRQIHTSLPDAQFYRVSRLGYWVFSTSKELLLTFDCPNELFKHTIKVNGVGFITNSSNCTIYSQDAVLYPYSKGYMTFNSLWDTIVVPNVSKLVLQHEINVIKVYQEHVNLNPHLETLDTIINRTYPTNKGYAHMIAVLKNIESAEQTFVKSENTKNTISWGLVIGSVFLFILCIFCCRGLLYKCCCDVCIPLTRYSVRRNMTAERGSLPTLARSSPVRGPECEMPPIRTEQLRQVSWTSHREVESLRGSPPPAEPNANV